MSRLHTLSIALLLLASLAAPEAADARSPGTPTHTVSVGATALGVDGMEPDSDYAFGPDLGTGASGFTAGYAYRLADHFSAEARVDMAWGEAMTTGGARGGLTAHSAGGVGFLIGPWLGYRGSRSEWTDQAYAHLVEQDLRRRWGPNPRTVEVEGTTVRHSLTAGLQAGLRIENDCCTSTLALNFGRAIETDVQTDSVVDGPARSDGRVLDASWTFGFHW